MMIPTRRSALVLAALAAFLLPGRQQVPVEAQRPAPGASPKLVVVLVADQMRSDYFDRFGPEMSGGLKRIATGGATFPEAAYPYLNTVTCAGHATIGTGSFPYRHGMVLNAWVARETGLSRGCTEDRSTTAVSYDSIEGTGESAKDLLVPTLAAQIRERAKGRVVSMSLKARSAIGLAGRRGDAVTWFDDRGFWATSSAYTKAPVPLVKEFIAANPLTADLDKVWNLALPPEKYQHPDEGVGERPPTGWTRIFPHPLAVGGKADAGYVSRWKASPFADEYLGRMAAASVDALKLGRGEGVDFLGVAFSTLDGVGHAFGPNSHEVHDVVIRLDRTIGRLLDHLDATVGKGNYVVAFSSDHGVATIPEQVPGAGRQGSREVLDAINQALQPLWGPGTYAVTSAYTDIYLAGGILKRLQDDDKARAAVLAALKALPGVVQAFTADEVDDSSARKSADPVKRAAALSFHKARSGDLIIVPRENWILSTAATTHGTLYPYDTRVPVMFFGAGVKPGHYPAAATPADVAPTLAAIAGVRIDKTDGQVLADAVAR